MNVDKPADKLSPGQIKLIKAKKGYRMNAYSSHRERAAPDWVQANTKKNAAEVKLDPTGGHVRHAALPDMPFPVPKNGVEAM